MNNISAAIGAGLAAIFPYLAVEATLNEKSTVTLGVVVSVGATLIGLAWKASSTVQHIQDQVERIDEKLGELPCQAAKLQKPVCPNGNDKA